MNNHGQAHRSIKTCTIFIRIYEAVITEWIHVNRIDFTKNIYQHNLIFYILHQKFSKKTKLNAQNIWQRMWFRDLDCYSQKIGCEELIYYLLLIKISIKIYFISFSAKELRNISNSLLVSTTLDWHATFFSSSIHIFLCALLLYIYVWANCVCLCFLCALFL